MNINTIMKLINICSQRAWHIGTLCACVCVHLDNSLLVYIIVQWDMLL